MRLKLSPRAHNMTQLHPRSAVAAKDVVTSLAASCTSLEDIIKGSLCVRRETNKMSPARSARFPIFDRTPSARRRGETQWEEICFAIVGDHEPTLASKLV